MPDTLSLSTGVSLGLLAGIVSGVCYLFANGLTKSKETKDVYTKKSIAAGDKHICRRCGGDTLGGLVPCICEYHDPVKFESGAWFLRQVQRALSLMPWSLSTDKLEQIDEECEGTSDNRDLHNVREFLEAISSKLAGGPLEGIRVAPLYDHPAYLPKPQAAHSNRTIGASGAHAQLKRLVARVVEEAAALPALARYAAEPSTPTESSYEDLLATAILNKVIERYQTESGSGGRSSGIHSASASPSPSERSSPRSLELNSRNTREISPSVSAIRGDDDVSDWEEGEATDDAVELPRRVPFPEFGGDIVHQTENIDRDFDEVSGSDIQAIDGSWEENWLFQKKKIKNIQSVPVPMLVPNSNTEYRVLIGDRDADDTTDLSDNASDTEENETYQSDIKKVLESKHVIGGKPKVDEELDFEPDSLMSVNGSEEFEKIYNEYSKSEDTVDAVEVKNVGIQEIDRHEDSILVIGVDSGPLPKTEFNLKEEIHRTAINGHDVFEDLRNTKEMSIDSLEMDGVPKEKESTNTLSNHEREGEYEETVTIPVQRYADSLRRKHFEDEPQTKPASNETEDELMPGTIAYRERKKWLNYVEMPNNPYSPEAIQKRLLAKSTSSLFDSLTSKNNLDDKFASDEEVTKSTDSEDKYKKINSSQSTECLKVNDRSQSPSPKMLKDVLAEEVPQYKRYGRDYYIKEAKLSSGGREKTFSDTSSISSSINKSSSLDNFDTDFASPELLIQQFNSIAANQDYTKFNGKESNNISVTTVPIEGKNEILIEYEDTNEVFVAKPVMVEDQTDRQFEDILDSVNTRTQSTEPEKSPTRSIENSYSSSSIEDSIKIYNIQTGEIVKCKPEDKVSRYECDENDNIHSVDNKISGEIIDRLSQNVQLRDDAGVEPDLKQSESKLEKISEIDEILPQLPKVKELAKKFVSMDNLNEPTKPPHQLWRQRSKENLLDTKDKSKQLYMHSLTARSISKQFREELKLSKPTSIKVPGGANEIPEGADEVVKEHSPERPPSPVPTPGTIKTKLAFFESLKSKFSSK
ncbi:uncharacterized protein LOC125059993 isoform X3 [Pieris napi]|uniref:uncharacterized protein LOC125059993 isoform X3 n=1 Tax=Pieris napi TaxID=78633 RepID=UPI001FBA9EC5|nr:uncharacterized protein LOC125059993 isoform X3 [Pieris napi]